MANRRGVQFQAWMSERERAMLGELAKGFHLLNYGVGRPNCVGVIRLLIREEHGRMMRGEGRWSAKDKP